MKSPSFHGIMTGREAELILEKHGSEKCYLTHYDATSKVYFLSVKTKTDVYMHFVIDITRHQNETQHELRGSDKEFDSISELLNFYENKPVNLEVDCIGDAVQSESYKQKNDHIEPPVSSNNTISNVTSNL